MIWICRNGPDEDNGRLEKLAAAGNGEALYALAQRVNKTDRLKARRLMAAIADASYPPAVEFDLRLPKRTMTRWE